jgi:hypothetical protein
MRNILLLLSAVLLASSCQSLERLERVSPLSAEVAKDRVNLWPLFYKNGDQVAVLWPLYDQDEEGFALRPLVTEDGSDWELLPPLAWWNTESKNWVFVPAYSLGDSWGLFPVMGIGDFSYVGPAWWDENSEGETDSYGLFPLATISPGLNWAALAWWDKNPEGDIESYGLFPVVSQGQRFNQIGPVVWGYDDEGETDYFSTFPLFGFGTLDDGREVSWAGPVWWVDNEEDEVQDYGFFPLTTHLGKFHQVGPVFWGETEEGDTDYLVAFPLYGYARTDDGGGYMLSLLGGTGWDENGDTEWLNVLGPVYHHSEGDGEESTHVLWPIVSWAEDTQEKSWSLWPALGHTEAKPDADSGPLSKSWALAGLYSTASSGQLDRWRLSPLYSFTSPRSGPGDLFDWISLVSYEDRGEGMSSLSLGTPLLFNYHDDAEQGMRWNALLGIFDYESDGEDSSFDVLYYLYRQQTTGQQTRRDLFPFMTWDSSPKGSEFSFLWRLLHYESNGDQSGGHILFIPWGETEAP